MEALLLFCIIFLCFRTNSDTCSGGWLSSSRSVGLHTMVTLTTLSGAISRVEESGPMGLFLTLPLGSISFPTGPDEDFEH